MNEKNNGIAIIPVISFKRVSALVFDLETKIPYLFDSSTFHSKNLNILFGKDIIKSIKVAGDKFIPQKSENGTCTQWILSFLLTANEVGCEDTLDFLKKMTSNDPMNDLKNNNFMLLMINKVSEIVDGSIIENYDQSKMSDESYCISEKWLNIFNMEKQSKKERNIKTNPVKWQDKIRPKAGSHNRKLPLRKRLAFDLRTYHIKRNKNDMNPKWYRDWEKN